jgi:hypothetical protein
MIACLDICGVPFKPNMLQFGNSFLNYYQIGALFVYSLFGYCAFVVIATGSAFSVNVTVKLFLLLLWWVGSWIC